jgi:Ser/Thr protein kinase RdoA (MazF antagonist)
VSDLPAVPTPLPPDANEVAIAFGLGTPAGEAQVAARGELGRVWRLTTSRGSWAVKELWDPPTELGARNDVALQLAALDAGIVAPRPQVGPDGNVLATVRALDGSPRTVRVYAWVDLTERSPGPTVAGSILGRLHGLGFAADEPPHPWYEAPVGEPRWRELAGEATRSGVPWAGALAALVPELVALEALLGVTPGASRLRCHRDFCPDNVLVGGDGRPVVIDWENAGSCPTDGELAMAALDFGGTDDRGAVDFVAGYAAAGGPGAIRNATAFATSIAVQGHLLEFYGRRRLAAAATAEDRERSDWRMATILARPITHERIDRLISSLNP